MKVDILTLFPDMFDSPLKESLLKKAIENSILEVCFTNMRDYSTNKHHKVDDYPYGGGKGLVISPEPVVLAYESIEKKPNSKTIFLSPGGKVLNQKKLKELSQFDQLILLCGHYEGIDQRAIDMIVDEEISIGDYILTGGELPALVLIDGVSRYLDGVVGSKESVLEDSLSNGLLKYPQYTNPRKFREIEVPEVLLSGHHKKIEEWRLDQSYKRTKISRPDLWHKYLKNKKEVK
ncbi:MAG: tRNA (guanosine(37)-N1)-methyltransferase TrmD [Firmicutes bacterium]|nr:tRNA (guanosine(37)-N1)-methyltransferase TrmD [Bacillota bacterium]